MLTWGWCLFCQFTLCLTLSSSLSEAPAVCPWLGLRILCFQHSCPIPGVRLTDIISVRAELSLSSPDNGFNHTFLICNMGLTMPVLQGCLKIKCDMYSAGCLSHNWCSIYVYLLPCKSHSYSELVYL